MKTTNWQTKALALFISAAALWLATACTNADPTYYPIDYPEGGLRIVSSDTCEIEVPLVPSPEFADLPESIRQRIQDDPDAAYYSMVSIIRTRREARNIRLAPEFKRIRDIFYANEDKVRKHPYYSGGFVEALSTSDGVPTDRIIVVIRLDHMVDLRTIPPEDQIPSCIAGVPVHMVVGRFVANSVEAGIQ